MAESTQIIYSYKELAEILVKERGIHEGLWGIYIRFGISAANLGQADNELKPTALIPVLEIGLQKFTELNNLSVDAAEVNPVEGRRRSGAKRATKQVSKKK